MSTTLKKTLLRVAGQHAVLTYHRPFANLMGSVEGALMLSQLLFWHDEGEPWTPAPDRRWQDLFGDACLSEYKIRQVQERMEALGFLDVDLRALDGAPTKHYRIDLDAFMQVWEAHVDGTAPSTPDTEPEDRPPPEEASLDMLLAVPPEDVTPTIAAEAWNRFANDMRENGHEISRVRKVTDQREGWVRGKRSDLWPDMQTVFDRIASSAHLRGENGWTASFDWIWRSENNYTKVLEGVYEDNGSDEAPDAPRNTGGESGTQGGAYEGVGFDTAS